MVGSFGHKDRLFRDAQDTVNGVTDGRATVWRWRDAFQREFQARMDWCVQPRDGANHQPLAVCEGDRTRAVLTRYAEPGGTICLSAAGSSDPDGNELTCCWWVYPEAGTYPEEPTMDNANSPQVKITFPPNATGDAHVILEVTDDGDPPLTSYRRVIIEVGPSRRGEPGSAEQ